jgi:hypothetical protein
MPKRDPIHVKNLDIYGNAAMPWSRARDQLAMPPGASDPGSDRTPLLSTTAPDGDAHTAPVGAVWYDGDMYFTSGAGTRKSRNLAMHPRGTIAAHLKGIDVVLEGEVSRVTDAETLETLAQIYRDGGWPARVAGDAFTAEFSAPSAGPPPWNLYRFRVDTAFGVSTAEPWGATRWRFAP